MNVWLQALKIYPRNIDTFAVSNMCSDTFMKWHLYTMLMGILIIFSFSACHQPAGMKNRTNDPEGFSIDTVRKEILLTKSNIKLKSGHFQNIAIEAAYATIYFDVLNLLSSLNYVTDSTYLFNEKVKILIRHGKITLIPFRENINPEYILKLNPTFWITTLHDYNQSETVKKIQKSGIQVVPLSDYMEPTCLQQSAWINFFGYWANQYSLSQKIFDAIKQRYDSIRRNIHSKDTLKVLCGFPYRGQWYLPSTDSKIAKIIHDAGGICISPGESPSGTLPVSKEWIYLHAREADVWINVNEKETMISMLNELELCNEIKAFRNKRVYNYIKRKKGPANDIFESGILYPDRWLMDLYIIFHQGNEDNLYFYKRLPEE
ncbi:MAG: hypothetical protein KatS3mg028_1562 [Bacteroidia bacterium]|nr:MAG: hypothetical protein KatS3mg028_1562 [Bacteroidia bacterium]